MHTLVHSVWYNSAARHKQGLSFQCLHFCKQVMGGEITVVQRNTPRDPRFKLRFSQVHNIVHSNFKPRQLITSVILCLQEVPAPRLVHCDSERQHVMWPPLVQQPHLNLSMVGDTKYIFLWQQGSTGSHRSCYLIKSMPAAKCLKTLQVTISQLSCCVALHECVNLQKKTVM